MHADGHPVRSLPRRLALAFVRGGKDGRVHSSFCIGLVAVMLTVAFLVLTFGIYDSYAEKLETIALSVYPHVVVIDRASEQNMPDEGDEAETAAVRCRRICRGEIVLDRREEQGRAGIDRAPIERLAAIRDAVMHVAPEATVAPLIFDQANLTLRLGGSRTRPIVRRLRVLGIETGGKRWVPEVDRFVSQPLLDRLEQDPTAVLVSTSLARSLWGDQAIGHRSFEVMTESTPQAGREPLRFDVAGTFALGFHSLAENLIITSLEGAQALLDMPGEASYFGIGLEDAYRSQEIRRALRRPLTEASFSLSDWMGIAGGDFATIRLFRSILMVVLGMSLIITALGIRNTLAIVTVERRRQIGILRALGLRDAPIRRIFLWIALGLGSVGTILGLPLGTLGSMVFGRWLDHALADLLPIRGVEIGIQPMAMAQVAGLVLAASAVTALVSVRRALDLDPVRCLAAE